MTRLAKKRSKKTGLAPGSLVHVGDKKTETAGISLIEYDAAGFYEKDAKAIEDCLPLKESPAVTWINIDGVHHGDTIEKIGRHFKLHPLLLEDIMNTEQRPKTEDYEDHLFIVLNMLSYDEKDGEVKAEQVSLILGPHFVISFQEKKGDIFNPVRERIRNNKGIIRRSGADYLAYSLIDAVIDNYFVILEKFGEKIEVMEDELIESPDRNTSRVIHEMKREMIILRKSVWPLRELISTLQRNGSPLIHETTLVYLRDVYDHTIQVIDTIETFRDMLAGMLDLYLSSVSNRMNEVMKVLTIIATIFIPLTFIAGIYGMNFNPEKSPLNMPELNWYLGYPAVLSVMAVIGIVMVVYFKRKKWF